MVKYQASPDFVSAIVEVLRQYGPANTKEICKYLEAPSWLKPSVNAVNKVLNHDLVGQVKLDEDGKWVLTQEDVVPLAEIKGMPAKKTSRSQHSNPHILFVCGKNQWRSPTAERIYRNDKRIEVRSAGMSGKSKHPISETDIEWADLILVMERGYKSWIVGSFRNLSLPAIENLDIPDEYQYMDDELITLIEKGVEFHIQRLEKEASSP
jgi:predicted protein tyrosine phosphatase